MKTNLIYLIALAGVLCTGFLINSDKVAAAPVPSPGAGTPPIGKVVDVTLVAWPLSTQVTEKINGTLISMQSDWIIVAEGSYEHWIPTAKVMEMKASR